MQTKTGPFLRKHHAERPTWRAEPKTACTIEYSSKATCQGLQQKFKDTDLNLFFSRLKLLVTLRFIILSKKTLCFVYYALSNQSVGLK